MLGVLGAPENYTASTTGDADLAGSRAVVARLRDLERARGCGFDAPATGSAYRYAHNRVEASLAELRRAAADRAEGLVNDAMRDRTQIDADEFHRRVFDLATIEKATGALVRELTEYLTAKVGLTADDVLADLRATPPSTVTVDGAAGRRLQWAGNVAGAGLAIASGAARVVAAGALVSAAAASSTLGVIAVANIWNPVGWTLAIGGIAAGLTGPRIRKWLRRRGARRREEELSRARGAARKTVADTFDGLRDDMVAWFVDAARQAVVERLGVAVDQALLLRRIVATAADRSSALQSAADRQRREVRSGDSAAVLLHAAVRACEEARRSVPFGRSVWLGETWCDDPVGLVDGPAAPVEHAGRTARGPLGDQVADRLRRVLAETSTKPRPGAGADWLTWLTDLLADDHRPVRCWTTSRHSPSTAAHGWWSTATTTWGSRRSSSGFWSTTAKPSRRTWWSGGLPRLPPSTASTGSVSDSSTPPGCRAGSRGTASWRRPNCLTRRSWCTCSGRPGSSATDRACSGSCEAIRSRGSSPS